MAKIFCSPTLLRIFSRRLNNCYSSQCSVSGLDGPAGSSTSRNVRGMPLGAHSIGNSNCFASRDFRVRCVNLSGTLGFTLKIGMKFSVDAHAIGRHLAGNEVYIRNLLNSFAAIDRESEFIAYLSVDDPSPLVPSRVAVRRVSANPFARLGFELSARLREDRPDLLHVQYTAPLGCPV